MPSSMLKNSLRNALLYNSANSIFITIRTMFGAQGCACFAKRKRVKVRVSATIVRVALLKRQLELH
jgi:hypothetical protein